MEDMKDHSTPAAALTDGASASDHAAPSGAPASRNHNTWWLQLLDVDRNGHVRNTQYNLDLILEMDDDLQGIRQNALSGMIEVTKPLPWREIKRRSAWREADDAHLTHFVEDCYGVFTPAFYGPALLRAADVRSFHPIRDYLYGLEPWDGVERLDTLLMDYLGAEDSPYVRAVTRKLLVAALRRLAEPGLKFDNILVLSGPQGVGKSTLIARLGMDWYSDSLSISDMNDKTAAEKLQGYWLLEISEMAGMKKADLEKVKGFLTRQDDKYREPYSRRVRPHPRQCVFVGTTNSTDGFLRDVTGNRRYWTVPVTGEGRFKPWDLDQATVDQIWAEAVVHIDEPLTLPSSLEREAAALQRASMEHDDREGLVRAYLDTPIPSNWGSLDLIERIDWLRGLPPARCRGAKTGPRTSVSNIEIWCECFRNRQQDLTRRDSAQISAIMAAVEGWQRTDQRGNTRLYGWQRQYRRITPETVPLNMADGEKKEAPAQELP